MARVFAVSGASGFVGDALCEALSARGDRVLRLVRGTAQREDERAWTPGQVAGPELLADVDVVVHLAGAPISVRWTPTARAAILGSRVDGTRTLAAAVAARDGATRLISTSAVGYFGDTGDAVVDERTPSGAGFAAEVCRAWEAEALKAGPGTAIVRVGLVLAPHGGVLKQLLPVFRAGAGGRTGPGTQWMPWISLDDLVAVYLFAADHPALRGPLIACAPSPVRNADFSAALGRALRRPALLPSPAFALKLAFGDMARELLLGGQRAQPAALERAGFAWRDTNLDATLQRLLA